MEGLIERGSWNSLKKQNTSRTNGVKFLRRTLTSAAPIREHRPGNLVSLIHIIRASTLNTHIALASQTRAALNFADADDASTATFARLPASTELVEGNAMNKLASSVHES